MPGGRSAPVSFAGFPRSRSLCRRSARTTLAREAWTVRPSVTVEHRVGEQDTPAASEPNDHRVERRNCRQEIQNGVARGPTLSETNKSAVGRAAISSRGTSDRSPHRSALRRQHSEATLSGASSSPWLRSDIGIPGQQPFCSRGTRSKSSRSLQVTKGATRRRHSSSSVRSQWTATCSPASARVDSPGCGRSGPDFAKPDAS